MVSIPNQAKIGKNIKVITYYDYINYYYGCP